MFLFISDYDNTLFHHDGRGYLKEDIEAIRNFQKSGNLFGICTGRSLKNLLVDFEKEKPFQADFYICSSGAEIADRNMRVIYQKYFKPEETQHIYELTEGEHLFCPMGYQYCSLSDFMLAGKEEDPNFTHADFDLIKNCDISTMSFEFDSLKEAEAFLKKLENIYEISSVSVNGSSIDLTPLGISKKSGVLNIQKLYSDTQGIACIGDNINDLPMLEVADCSFTLNDSNASVKEYADYVVGSISEAIAVFLDAMKER